MCGVRNVERLGAQTSCATLRVWNSYGMVEEIFYFRRRAHEEHTNAQLNFVALLWIRTRWPPYYGLKHSMFIIVILKASKKTVTWYRICCCARCENPWMEWECLKRISAIDTHTTIGWTNSFSTQWIHIDSFYCSSRLIQSKSNLFASTNFIFHLFSMLYCLFIQIKYTSYVGRVSTIYRANHLNVF